VHYTKSRSNITVEENSGLRQENWKEEERRRRRRVNGRY
jgi:hypothetical protein